MSRRPILIVGAGPTGLVLALGLARRNIPFRLIDKASGPGEHSRAMAVHARTLEFYRQFGFADAVVAEGVRTPALHLREVDANGVGRAVAAVHFSELGAGLSPYPFVLTYAQDLHERFLIDRLAAAGGRVEWNTALTEFDQDSEVWARLLHDDGREEEAIASFICGCDGAHSTVRAVMRVDFPGGTYDQLFHVADVWLDGPFDTDLRVNLGPEILELVLPVRATGMSRIIGLVPPHMSNRHDLTFEDIRARVEPMIGRRVEEVNWFSTYRVHHRVAAQFRQGAAFLAGDAGHLHSPAGGQGMNTGIGDAVNLAWKLAQVWEGRASPRLLDTYEEERIPFARQLVATTDRAFNLLVARGVAGEVIRRLIAPAVAGTATRFAAVRRAIFQTVSQTRIAYPGSALSSGRAGRVRGGDRLPWTGQDGDDNFAPLQSLDWQVHVYGAVPEALRSVCSAAGLPLHRVAWGKAAQAAGLADDSVFLVRPDGYVAVAAAAGEAATAIDAFLQTWDLRFAPAAA